MSVLTLNKGNSNEAGKTIKDIFDDVFGSSRRPQTNIPGIASLPKDRRNKVMMLRSQLAHGTYNIDERVIAALDSILTDIKP